MYVYIYVCMYVCTYVCVYFYFGNGLAGFVKELVVEGTSWSGMAAIDRAGTEQGSVEVNLCQDMLLPARLDERGREEKRQINPVVLHGLYSRTLQQAWLHHNQAVSA